MDAILEIARKHKLRVVEDCAQCCGGRYKGKYVGSIGDMGINSFQLSKTITAGEGGAVTTNDPKLFERAVRFHDVGSLRSPYTEELKGGLLAAFAACNFRMNEFTGAVLNGAGAEARDHLQGRAGQRPEGPRGHRRPAGTQTAEVGRTSKATWASTVFLDWAPASGATSSCGRCGPRASAPRGRAARSSCRPTSGSRTR